MRTIIGAEGQVLILHISRMGGWGQVACWPNFPIAGCAPEETGAGLRFALRLLPLFA